jgi:hypothetical protein
MYASTRFWAATAWLSDEPDAEPPPLILALGLAQPLATAARAVATAKLSPIFR